jgi:hypothetical protein
MSHGAWIAVVALVAVVGVASLVGAVALGVRVWRTRVWLDQLGVGGKIAFWGALIYTVFPIDLLPDPIYLDDMGVLAGSAIYLTRLIHKRRQAASLDPVNPSRPGVTRSP